MDEKWGDLLDVMVFLMLFCAMICVVMFILTALVLAIMVRPIKFFYKGVVFIANKSWNWIRSPLSD